MSRGPAIGTEREFDFRTAHRSMTAEQRLWVRMLLNELRDARARAASPRREEARAFLTGSAGAVYDVLRALGLDEHWWRTICVRHLTATWAARDAEPWQRPAGDTERYRAAARRGIATRQAKQGEAGEAQLAG